MSHLFTICPQPQQRSHCLNDVYSSPSSGDLTDGPGGAKEYQTVGAERAPPPPSFDTPWIQNQQCHMQPHFTPTWIFLNLVRWDSPLCHPPLLLKVPSFCLGAETQLRNLRRRSKIGVKITYKYMDWILWTFWQSYCGWPYFFFLCHVNCRIMTALMLLF